jgi:histidinol phosphatase-like enzyme (inositol monophosphatase family)
LSADLALASRLADAAGAAIRPYFRAEFGLETKSDATPVTLADRAAEAAIRTILEAERPEEGIIGEEFGATRETASRVWVLDPIDGTRSFVGGRPIFGTLISLVEDGVPIVGLIDQPISGERWVGAVGQRTLFNGSPASTRRCATLAQAVQATTSPAAFSEDRFRAFNRLIPATRDTLYGGDCYNYGLVAIGQIDLVVESGLKLHDFAALVPVVEGAGGVMCDWEGQPLTSSSDGHVIACGDAALLPEILGHLNG